MCSGKGKRLRPSSGSEKDSGSDYAPRDKTRQGYPGHLSIKFVYILQRLRRVRVERNTLSPENLFAVQMCNVYDVLLAETHWRY